MHIGKKQKRVKNPKRIKRAIPIEAPGIPVHIPQRENVEVDLGKSNDPRPDRVQSQ